MPEYRAASALRPTANRCRPYTERCSIIHMIAPSTTSKAKGIGMDARLPVVNRRSQSNPCDPGAPTENDCNRTACRPMPLGEHHGQQNAEESKNGSDRKVDAAGDYH